MGGNCTNPLYIQELITHMKKHTSLPIAVYPNSGETFDPLTKTWSEAGNPSRAFGKLAYTWMEAGACAIGECCRTDTSHIRKIKEAREGFIKPKKSSNERAFH